MSDDMSKDPRQAYRQVFVNSWAAYQSGKALNPLEQQIVAVLREHPEYAADLEKNLNHLNYHNHPDQPMGMNPFLHLSLHLSLHEQIQLDRPAGIRALYQHALKDPIHYNPHELQHLMMTVLEKTLLEAQDHGSMPDEWGYLNNLKKLLNL